MIISIHDFRLTILQFLTYCLAFTVLCCFIRFATTFLKKIVHNKRNIVIFLALYKAFNEAKQA